MDDEIKDEDNIGSFYMGRARKTPEPKRLLPPGVLTIIALVALGGIVWYAYPRGAEKYTNVDVPVVKADTAPIKAAPANPGGMEVRHQDSTVFDPLQKNGGAEVEKLAPTPEEPMDKAQAMKDITDPVAPSTVPPPLHPQVNDAGNGAEKIIPQAEEVKPPPVAVPPADDNVPVIKASDTPAPEKEEVKPQKKEEASATEYKNYIGGDDNSDQPVDKPVDKPLDKPAASAPAKKAAAIPIVRADTSTAGQTASGEKYEVQLGSYREEADAKRDWARFQKKYAEYLGKLKMRLVKADIPGKGTYYRLHAGTVSKDRAHEICDALKADHGVGCILAKK